MLSIHVIFTHTTQNETIYIEQKGKVSTFKLYADL